MSFVQLHQLRKTFPDGTEAVKGIALSIERGEFVVLLGPSGCGKTTTLRMIAGLETPTAGRIELDGQNVTKMRPSQRDVGFVFQFYALYPHLSVRQNIAFPLVSIGTSTREIESRVAQAAQQVGLTNLMDTYPRHLSGGDQQRVALARAMVRRPRVWLMDEPLGTLDADQRLGMREFIRSRQLESKTTTVYVTHDQEEAISLADRIVVMDGGVIRQIGTPDEIYDRPADLFIAHFVGSPGMNFIQRQSETLGIRPEHVKVAHDGSIAGRIVARENLGVCIMIHVESDLGRLVIRSQSDCGSVGDSVRIELDSRYLLHFDSASGNRL